jgi:hypothetical protein
MAYPTDSVVFSAKKFVPGKYSNSQSQCKKFEQGTLHAQMDPIFIPAERNLKKRKTEEKLLISDSCPVAHFYLFSLQSHYADRDVVVHHLWLEHGLNF